MKETKGQEGKVVVALRYHAEDFEYGIHKLGCRDIQKTIQRKNQVSYPSWLGSGLKDKYGKEKNGHFHNLQDAIEAICKETVNENEVLDGNAEEYIYTNEDDIEIFNCAK